MSLHDVSAGVCTMRKQHWTKSEHPLPYIFLFNRDTYSVKRKIHTEMFLFKCWKKILLTDILHLGFTQAKRQNNNWKAAKLLQELNAGNGWWLFKLLESHKMALLWNCFDFFYSLVLTWNYVCFYFCQSNISLHVMQDRLWPQSMLKWCNLDNSKSVMNVRVTFLKQVAG